MMPGKGFRPDPDAVKARRPHWRMLASRARIGAAASPVLATNNRALISTSKGGPGVRNQQNSQGCTGFATSSGMTLRNAIAGIIASVVSPVNPYTVGRDIMRGPPAADGSLVKLTDDGAEPSAVIMGCQVYGVCSEADWPFDPSRVNDDPTPAQLQIADKHLLDGGYFLTEPTASPAQTLSGLLQALSSGYPVCAAVPASGSEFESYSSGVLSRAQLTGDVDHYVLLTDYAWEASAQAFQDALTQLAQGTVPSSIATSLVIDGLNSWGTDWGTALDTDLGGGLFQLAGDCVLSSTDLAAINTNP